MQLGSVWCSGSAGSPTPLGWWTSSPCFMWAWQDEMHPGPRLPVPLRNITGRCCFTTLWGRRREMRVPTLFILRAWVKLPSLLRGFFWNNRSYCNQILPSRKAILQPARRLLPPQQPLKRPFVLRPNTWRVLPAAASRGWNTGKSRQDLVALALVLVAASGSCWHPKSISDGSLHGQFLVVSSMGTGETGLVWVFFIFQC